MLVLGRTVGQELVITTATGEEIRVVVVSVRPKLRLGIIAAKVTRVMRGELLARQALAAKAKKTKSTTV